MLEKTHGKYPGDVRFGYLAVPSRLHLRNFIESTKWKNIGKYFLEKSDGNLLAFLGDTSTGELLGEYRALLGFLRKHFPTDAALAKEAMPHTQIAKHRSPSSISSIKLRAATPTVAEIGDEEFNEETIEDGDKSEVADSEAIESETGTSDTPPSPTTITFASKSSVSIPATQIKFKNNVVTAYRQAEGKHVTNYRPWRKYLISLGYKFYWQAPGWASIIIVQDQYSANRALKNKNAIVNNIGYGGQSCYGGTKGFQIKCRSEFAAKHGCTYDSLRMQPPQYRMWIPNECRSFFDTECYNEDSSNPIAWIEKPTGGQHGKGMQVHAGCAPLKAKFKECGMRNQKSIIMEYLDPALLDGHKFDLRTYLLVASLSPLIIFHGDGFVRRATSKFSSDLSDKKAHITNDESQDENDDHFWDFGRLEKHLHEHSGFPADYMRNAFRKQALRVEHYVFQTARASMMKRPGTFQLFALDWIIGSDGRAHMLEANSNPLVTDYPIPGFPEVWHDLMDLIVDLHTAPNTLGPMSVYSHSDAQGYQKAKDRAQAEGLTYPLPPPSNERYSYKERWTLIFNELEEKEHGITYNPCEALRRRCRRTLF